jgi:hypothetical protein
MKAKSVSAGARQRWKPRGAETVRAAGGGRGPRAAARLRNAGHRKPPSGRAERNAAAQQRCCAPADAACDCSGGASTMSSAGGGSGGGGGGAAAKGDGAQSASAELCRTPETAAGADAAATKACGAAAKPCTPCAAPSAPEASRRAQKAAKHVCGGCHAAAPRGTRLRARDVQLLHSCRHLRAAAARARGSVSADAAPLTLQPAATRLLRAL